MTNCLAGALFAFIISVTLCAESLSNEALMLLAVVMVALALAVAVVSNRAYIKKKAASRAGTLKAARPAKKAGILHPKYIGL